MIDIPTFTDINTFASGYLASVSWLDGDTEPASIRNIQPGKFAVTPRTTLPIAAEAPLPIPAPSPPRPSARLAARNPVKSPAIQ